MDTPDGTGDHENYFLDKSDAYELDGTEYKDCIKKAVNIRSKTEHESWTAIDKTFLFSSGFKFMYYDMMDPFIKDQIPVLRPEYS